ncbi:TPA: tail fiber domain-containing protein [Escherichia coli]|nr:phage tail protein [Escherichia coli]EHC0956606.1 phage tail protein [Shigella sonnei]EFK5944475.1 phage tail protein [Escherichia coli]EIA2637543.1 tail fiber domain-containing protein [Shigella sonnei]HBH7170048.1 tail fiber domain-containing protein [Shigella sonnei]
MWYREGTITFTQGSNTLVGAGTAWNVTANGVLPGMIVIGPDNKLYEIKRVTSDTNIVLSEPYTGETQSEVPCRIITTYEGDLTQFSARFTALMSRMSADSKSMRSWLTALDEVTIEREDGTEVTVKPLMQIVNEHNENVEWYKNNTDAIDAAGDKAREAAASAAAAAESANTAGEKASQASQSASAAASSQSAASASATAAKKSETNAAASQQSAATSASTATTKASEAATSARDAAASKEAAKSSETNASLSASSAASSATAAGNSAKAAKTSETNARSSETAAGQSASAAAGSKTAAASSASAASTSAGQASASATAAGKSAESAASSASTATTKAGEATEQASAAARSASAAKTSETNAKASETSAESSKTAAASSASSAASSASSASASKDEATRQASAAKGSATTASTKATEAAGSATAASQSKTAAESAATRAEAAADRAEEIAGAVAMEDASLTTKGVVKLSSAVDSTSESLAATPKAVKVVNDNANSRVPSNRKINGKALTADITLTPKDIGTLNSITMSFSGGAGWFKLATVTMPQESSVVYISLIGGAGFNVGSPHQAGISELVLRAGNGNPKGITGALWKRTAVGLTNFAWINTSGDTYDIYVEIGNYATSVNIHWDCTANATVSIYTSPTYSASKPSSVTDGVVYTMYSTHQKPTPLDIGALPTTGGTVSGPLSVTGGLTGSLNGNASTATKLQTARSIGGVVFDGSANINLPGVNTTGNQNTTGNAATATKLQTARTIGGVSFDGTANINLPGVNTTGNQNTTGNAATATKLQMARTIGGVSFDGTANINLPGVNTAGNQNTTGNAATATKLQTARNINGVKFDGSGDININTLVSRGRVTALSGSTQGTAGIQMYEAYNNSYPTMYGNVLHMKGASASGEGEMLVGWSGTDGAHAPVYVRSRRDTSTANWSGWAQVYTTAHKPTAKDVGAAQTFSASYSTGAGNWTTAEFIAWLKERGAFEVPYWMMKGSWSYADNKIITDTGVGNICLAGAVIEVLGTEGAMTIRVTTPTTTTGGGIACAQFTYINHGSAYAPAWRRDYNTTLKPTAADVGALPISGGTMTGVLTLQNVSQPLKTQGGGILANDGNLYINKSGFAGWIDALFMKNSGGTMSGQLKIRSTDGLRIYDAAYGMIFRRSENNFYLIPTAKDQGENGDIGSLRPFYVNLTNGRVAMGNGAVVDGGLGLGVVNGLGGNSIVLGDNDTGFKQNGDGILDVYANSAHVFRFVNSTLQSLKPLSVTGDIASSAWVYANRFSINSGSGAWIDMRNQNVIFGGNAVSTNSAQALLRQDHADRKFFLGGLGNSQFGFYMINNSRTANGTDAAAYLQNDGTWVCAGNGSFNDVYIRSDRRSKRNIRKIERALDKLEQIEGVLYEIQVCGRYEQSGGLIAQDVQNVQPELVTVDHNDQSGEPRLRLNYNGVIGMLVEAVKELREEVRELKAKM